MEAHNRFDSNARSIFRENGIIGVDKVEFSTRNIIVGEKNYRNKSMKCATISKMTDTYDKCLKWYIYL